MDYPITVPGVGLSAGKFTNGNPVASLAASLDPAEWANAVTDEILNVIIQGGLTPTENTNTQLATAIKNMIRGGDYKDSVRFTTTANIVLSGLGTQAGGDWPTALTAGERIFPKNQTAGAENGIWIAAAGAWTRATDADTGAELNSGAIIPVESGTVNADTNWQLTTDGAIVVGATALTFAAVDAQNFASNAEILAGVLSTKKVSPLGLLQGLLGLGGASANDYIVIPYRDKTDGTRKNLYVQFGTFNLTIAALSTWTSTTAVFPIAFPNACLHISSNVATSAIGSGAPGGTTGIDNYGIDSITASNFRQFAFDTAQTGANAFQFLAIGF